MPCLLRRWLTGIAAALVSSGALPATLLGTIKAHDGVPLRGALVTLADPGNGFAETVFSDRRGGYRLATGQTGTLTLRVRAPRMADATLSLDLPAGAERVVKDFVLEKLATVEAIAADLPASAHFARVTFPTSTARQQFQTDCLSCHEIGNPFTRQVRSPELWTAIVAKMLVYSGYTSQGHLPGYADALHRAYDGSAAIDSEATTVDDASLTARITEWKLPGAIIAHDSEFNPGDGKFYTVDQGVDVLYVTDPHTNKTTTVRLPDGGVQLGGRFAERGFPIPFNLSVRHGVHSLQFGKDGKIYITAAIGGEIGVFDPVHQTYTAHRTAASSLYPHTIRMDATGIAWFTIAQSNQIGRFDPATGEIRTIELPKQMARADERQPLPYGIDVSPIDGSIWYSKLWANKIGRIDPKTFEVREYEPPLFGPRRLRFDASGQLWIPGFGDGTLTRLDTKAMTYKSYRIPTLAANEVEAPYAVAVHPQTQDVWVTANMSDRVFRFVPKEERFVAYRLPVRGSYFRDFFFPADGRVCAPSSPMPPRPDVIEGGSDSILCIDPRDRSRATTH